MSEFGFGVRAETTSCPEMKIGIQHYKDQRPVEIVISSNFGTPSIKFSDGSVLFIRTKGNVFDYELVVPKSPNACIKREWYK